MRALILVYCEFSTCTHEIPLKGKKETINTKIAKEINQTIKKELLFNRKPINVSVTILDNNKIVNKWTYKPTIR